MVICPNCGSQVASNQRFCGSCGTDVHTVAAPTPRATAPIADDRPSPQYAYSQPTNYGDYDAPAERRSGGNRAIIAGVIFFLVACCVVGWALLLIETALGFIAPGTATPTPKGGMLPLMFPLIG